MKKFLNASYMVIVLLLIYIPIFVLIIFSFNSSDSMEKFTGFSTQWYGKLAKEYSFVQSIIVSLFVAIIVSIISTVLGTLAAIGISKLRKVTQSMVVSVSNIPLINADVITAVALMLVFVALNASFGLFTLTLAHISFDIPYVIMTVLPRIRKVEKNLIEASLDLGAKPSQTLRKIVLPVLKPAIIAGFAIAFAMSFDDFIISYFTSGTQTNVATFIYTMKRIQPYINAFATITIVIMSLIIVGWNIYVCLNNQRKIFNEQILKGTYKDKTIEKIERKLSNLYLVLNKNHKAESEKDLLRKNIIHLEMQIEKENKWLVNKKTSILDKQLQKEEASKRQRNNYFSWFLKTWKPVLLSVIFLGSFITLSVMYVSTNTYDILVANWANYFPEQLAKEFEQKYDLKIKKVPYDTNEILYNKLNTIVYDVMVPSDYMVNKLIYEERLEKIDYNQINDILKHDGFTLEPFASSNVNETYQFDKKNKPTKISVATSLVNLLQKNASKDSNILDYSIPYFWGDVRIVINPKLNDWLKTKEVKFDANNNIEPTSISWDILWQASQAHKSVQLNDDYRNLFMIANQKNYQTIEPTSTSQVEQDFKILEKLINNETVALKNGDDITSTVKTGNFDVAVMYNGDAIYANEAYNKDNTATNFHMVVPRKNNEGTNIWTDNLVINKLTKHKKNVYKFIAFIIEKQDQLVKETGYTSPFKQWSEYILRDDNHETVFKNYKSVYIPLSEYGVDSNGKQVCTVVMKEADGAFTTMNDLASKLVDKYNVLLAGKIK